MRTLIIPATPRNQRNHDDPEQPAAWAAEVARQRAIADATQQFVASQKNEGAS